jgi:hypothetical protein
VERSKERESGVRTARVGSFAQVCAGRLVSLRVGQLVELADVEALSAAVVAACLRAGSDAVLCADVRKGTPLTGEVANAWSRAMRKGNGAIARSALLLDPLNTMLNLQVERVVHCAGHEHRRLFNDAEDLRAWLEVGLTDAERAGLRVFLDAKGKGFAENLGVVATMSGSARVGQ